MFELIWKGSRQRDCHTHMHGGMKEQGRLALLRQEWTVMKLEWQHPAQCKGLGNLAKGCESKLWADRQDYKKYYKMCHTYCNASQFRSETHIWKLNVLGRGLTRDYFPLFYMWKLPLAQFSKTHTHYYRSTHKQPICLNKLT